MMSAIVPPIYSTRWLLNRLVEYRRRDSPCQGSRLHWFRDDRRLCCAALLRQAQSARSAASGSMPAALRAGIQVANDATTMTNPAIQAPNSNVPIGGISNVLAS